MRYAAQTATDRLTPDAQCTRIDPFSSTAFFKKSIQEGRIWRMFSVGRSLQLNIKCFTLTSSGNLTSKLDRIDKTCVSLFSWWNSRDTAAERDPTKILAGPSPLLVNNRGISLPLTLNGFLGLDSGDVILMRINGKYGFLCRVEVQGCGTFVVPL